MKLQDYSYRIEYCRVEGSGNFNTMVNIIFYNLFNTVRQHGIREIHVDLTHGTNIIIQALMISSIIIKIF